MKSSQPKHGQLKPESMVFRMETTNKDIMGRWRRSYFGHYVLDEFNQPQLCELEEWAEMFEKFSNRIVAQERFGPVLISTVFLGLDHDFSYIGHDSESEVPENYQPVLWETMIFLNGSSHEEYMNRYRSHRDALRGHVKAVFIGYAMLARFLFRKALSELRDIWLEVLPKSKFEKTLDIDIRM